MAAFIVVVAMKSGPRREKTTSKKNNNNNNNNKEEEEEEEEEEFILVDLPKFVPMLPGETLTFEGLDTETPLLKTSSGVTYEGYYERTIGEALIVEPADKSCMSSYHASGGGGSGKKRVLLNANGEEIEEEEEEDDDAGANVRAATETRLKFRKPIE